MKAILLAAGFGTRLQPITNFIPKCLVPIKGKPLLEIWLENLTLSGVNDILINTHYLPEHVNQFVLKSRFSSYCKITFEENLLGTAGTLLKNLDFMGNEDCMLIHADNYCLANFVDFIKAHNNRPKNCLLTLMTFRTENPSSCGIIELDSDNIVIGFHEKVENPPGNVANGAVYILSVDFIKLLKHEFSEAKDFSTEIINNFLGKIYTFETKETFIDIGTIETFLNANSN